MPEIVVPGGDIDRLKTQFAAADALISQLNSTSSFLDSQLASLPGYTNGE